MEGKWYIVSRFELGNKGCVFPTVQVTSEATPEVLCMVLALSKDIVATGSSKVIDSLV